MARKSRKNYITQQNCEEVKYVVGAYVRISKENGESNSSVENQIKIIEQYLLCKKDMIIKKFYIDNGISSFSVRKEFDAMIADAKSGIINCVVVKDLSRFGRDYIKSGEYIEQIFPRLGIRFISINEGYDSKDGYDLSSVMFMAFKNIINMSYSGDVSNKVRSVIHNKMKLGEYIPAKYPVGYKKATECGKTVCVVDEQAAVIVKNIFRLYNEGIGSFKIAGIMNDNKSLRNAGIKEWNRYKIENILRNRFYIGDYVCNKTNNILLQKKAQKLPPEEWITIENHHEAIIDKTFFDSVQKKLKDNEHKFEFNNKKKDYKFYQNNLYCGDCGRKMKRRIWNGNTYFICPKYDYAKGLCSLKSIRDDRLRDSIFKIIQEHINILTEKSENINQLITSESQKYRQVVFDELSSKKEALLNIRQRVLDAINSSVSGYCENDADFVRMIYTSKIKTLTMFLNSISNSLSKKNDVCVKYADFKQLTPEMYLYYVNRVQVCDSGISIDFKI